MAKETKFSITISEVDTKVGSICKFDSKELEKIGEVNYLTAVGNPIDEVYPVKNSNGTTATASKSRYTSSCAHVRIVPTIGRTTSDADGASAATKYTPVVANQAATYIYQMLYNKNMNTANFAASDILKIILAIDSVLVRVNEIKLDLMVGAKAWNKWDLAMPNTLVRPNVNLSDLILNRATYIDRLDTLINRLAVVEIPLNLKYITWHCNLTNKIYVDDPLHKTTYYRVSYDAYWLYDHSTGEVKLNQANGLVNFTIGQEITALNSMIDELVADEDIVNLLANIRLIFGGDAISVDQFRDECPSFVYDYMFLSMLKNANYGPSADALVANYLLTEVNSGVKTSALEVGLVPAPIGTQTVSGATAYLGISFNQYVVSHDANSPKADELVVVTHWVNTYRSKPGVTDDGSNEYLWYHGSEVLTIIKCVTCLGAAGTANAATFTYDVDGTDVSTIGTNNNPYAPWQAIIMHQMFNFLPRLTFIYSGYSSSPSMGSIAGEIWQDTENLFKVSVPYLAGVHEYTLRNQIGITALE